MFQYILIFLTEWAGRLKLSQQIRENTKFGQAVALLIQEMIRSSFATQEEQHAVSILLCTLDKDQFEMECFALYPDYICQALIMNTNPQIWENCLERLLLVRDHISKQQLLYCRNSFESVLQYWSADKIPQNLKTLAAQIF